MTNRNIRQIATLQNVTCCILSYVAGCHITSIEKPALVAAAARLSIVLFNEGKIDCLCGVMHPYTIVCIRYTVVHLYEEVYTV